jgi:hypothetical protein
MRVHVLICLSTMHNTQQQIAEVDVAEFYQYIRHLMLLTPERFVEAAVARPKSGEVYSFHFFIVRLGVIVHTSLSAMKTHRRPWLVCTRVIVKQKETHKRPNHCTSKGCMRHNTSTYLNYVFDPWRPISQSHVESMELYIHVPPNKLHASIGTC